MRLSQSAYSLAAEAAKKSGHGFPIGWVVFGVVMLGLLYLGVRWARKQGRRG